MKTLAAALLLLAPAAAQDPAPERRSAEFTWKDAKVPVTYILPKGYDKAKKHPVVLTLPPGPGTADMVTWNLDNYWAAEGFARGWIVVAPEVAGPTLQAGGKDFADSLFAWMDRELSYDKGRVVATGCSNGGIGSFHLAAQAGERFAGVIALPGGYQGRAEALKGLAGKPVWLMVGSKDKLWVGLTANTKKLLEEVKAVVTHEVLEGKEHVFPVAPKALYDWLDKVPAPAAK